MNNLWKPRTTDEAFFQRTVANCRFPGGISASGQTAGFAANLFTRDAERMLRDLMDQPQYWPFIRSTLAILAQWQGVKTDERTNELLDATVHQLFCQIIGGIPVSDDDGPVVKSAKHWTGKWGVPMEQDPVDGWRFVIYNSSDGPPLYVIAVAEFCQATGSTAILKDRFLHRPTGEWRTVGEAVSRSLDFMYRAIHKSERGGLHGLYAVPNTNPEQTSPSGVMRDGFDSYLKIIKADDGRITATPIDYGYVAYVENQALCIEAFELAAQVLMPNDQRVPAWRKTARDLRQITFELLFMENQSFFAAGMDRTGLINMKSSAAFELLNGSFFRGVKDAPDYIGALVQAMYSPDFLTPIGVRMVSLEQAEILEGDGYSYQISSAWGVTDGLVAKGLRLQGMPSLGYDMGMLRLIGWFDHAGEAMEMGYVHKKTNQPLYNPFPPKKRPDGALVIHPAELGQIEQGWSATAALNELWAYQHGIPQEAYGTWQYALARQLRQVMRDIVPAAMAEPTVVIWPDLVKGKEIKERRKKEFGIAG